MSIPASRRALMLASLALPGMAQAQTRAEGSDSPSQPVRYINGFPPGGSTDILSRIWCAKGS